MSAVLPRRSGPASLRAGVHAGVGGLLQARVAGAGLAAASPRAPARTGTASTTSMAAPLQRPRPCCHSTAAALEDEEHLFHVICSAVHRRGRGDVHESRVSAPSTATGAEAPPEPRREWRLKVPAGTAKAARAVLSAAGLAHGDGTPGERALASVKLPALGVGPRSSFTLQLGAGHAGGGGELQGAESVPPVPSARACRSRWRWVPGRRSSRRRWRVRASGPASVVVPASTGGPASVSRLELPLQSVRASARQKADREGFAWVRGSAGTRRARRDRRR